MRLFVAGEADFVVLQQLVPEDISERVVLAVNEGGACEALLLVIFVDNAEQRSKEGHLLGDERGFLRKANVLLLVH